MNSVIPLLGEPVLTLSREAGVGLLKNILTFWFPIFYQIND